MTAAEKYLSLNVKIIFRYRYCMLQQLLKPGVEKTSNGYSTELWVRFGCNHKI